ncbi:MAG: hypothetical protein QM330_00140 [Acidobacteriota bacterium]|jgi:hypothetical protein|nr:hypothetical protein [Acidobacteriota bacterium]NLT32126.1 hypothetical protein [Acidobacteriota bacterium]
MKRWVLCREFHSRAEAGIVRQLLLANGIESYLNSDDCGAVDPALAFARGVQLFIGEEDVALAEEVLAAATDDVARSGAPE